ncbi:MAG: dihydrofolate reductase family protein [Aquihabitans sp.]
MSRVRVHNFSVSLDGFATGEDLTLDAPFGHAGHRLHEWMMATRFAHQEVLHIQGGSDGIDDAMAVRHGPGIGAEIMGAGKFGPPGWQDDPEWRGWWGEDPPFHTPTYVLTHRPLPSIEMDGGTTFHFLDASPTEALAVAKEAADGLDVRIGGGPTMLREFLAAGLVDHLHVVPVPIFLGRGVRLWDGLEGFEDGYEVEVASTPSGVTHLVYPRGGGGGGPPPATRRGRGAGRNRGPPRGR